MAWFGKRKSDVIDMTRMRHLLPASSDNEVEEIDLSNVQKPASSGTSSFDFLGSLASAQNLESSSGPITESLRDARRAKMGGVNELKIKLEDSEYKINDLTNRVREMEKRLRELERERR